MSTLALPGVDRRFEGLAAMSSLPARNFSSGANFPISLPTSAGAPHGRWPRPGRLPIPRVARIQFAVLLGGLKRVRTPWPRRRRRQCASRLYRSSGSHWAGVSILPGRLERSIVALFLLATVWGRSVSLAFESLGGIIDASTPTPQSQSYYSCQNRPTYRGVGPPWAK